MPNHLAKEASPYLLQHAGNPVDWYPWGEEPLNRARTEDKPILLSIGYSACHWCHVMAHESFENREIALYMNENFINIKVDREERPDLDHIYMQAVEALTESGGWPLTAFLTPEGKPFFGGTYFPPEDRQGFPGFPRVLKAALEAYHQNRQAVDQIVSQVIEMLKSESNPPLSTLPVNGEISKQAFQSLRQCFDREKGGFGRAPKFPHPVTLEFLLRYHFHHPESEALEMVELSLQKMARGGIYDQIGGGFHRYSTDNDWLVPHFEKMLYDNALLSQAYLHAYVVTGKQYYRTVVEGILDYVLREMTSPAGGFYSTQDADSEGVEGKYYLCSFDEVVETLGDRLGRLAVAHFGVTPEGNFDRLNILHIVNGQVEPETLEQIKTYLLKRRGQRVKPARDEKILLSWNGMMAASMAEAGSILKRPDYFEAAARNAEFWLSSMMVDGRVKHTYQNNQARIDGYLEDYAQAIQGLLALHHVSLSGDWRNQAVHLADLIVERFSDPDNGLLFDTETGLKDLFVRPRNTLDGATPSGSSVATLVLLKIAATDGKQKFHKTAEQSLRSVRDYIGNNPLGYSQWLLALDFFLYNPGIGR